MILQGPRQVKERFRGPSLIYGRDFVHVIIDNPAKRIILKILKISGILPIRQIKESDD
jgi:hypothetical protein